VTAAGTIVLLAACAAFVLAAGQTVDRPQFRAAASGVRLAAWVLRSGQPVGSLTTQDFELHDNGVRQSIHVTEVRDGRLDMALVAPARSTADGALADVHARFVRTRLRPDDTFEVVTASGGAMARDGTAFNGPPVSAGTTIVDASLAAVLRFPFAPSSGEGLRVLMVLLGRDADDSWAGPTDLGILAHRLNVVVVLGLLRDLGFDSVIATGGGSVTYVRSGQPLALTPGRPLRELATATGGRVVDVRRLDGRSELGAAVDQLRTHYVVTYIPQGVGRGGWHDLRLVVRKGRGYRVITRAGYWGAGVRPPDPLATSHVR
jgi:hypothetical protein